MDKKKDKLKGFECFRERTYRTLPMPTVSVTQSKRVTLNRAIVREILKPDDKHVLLYFNKNTRQIAIRLLKKPEKGSYRIFRDKRGISHGTINVSGFLNYYKIDHQKTKKFKAEFDSDERIIFFSLDKPIEAMDTD